MRSLGVVQAEISLFRVNDLVRRVPVDDLELVMHRALARPPWPCKPLAHDADNSTMRPGGSLFWQRHDSTLSLKFQGFRWIVRPARPNLAAAEAFAISTAEASAELRSSLQNIARRYRIARVLTAKPHTERVKSVIAFCKGPNGQYRTLLYPALRPFQYSAPRWSRDPVLWKAELLCATLRPHL